MSMGRMDWPTQTIIIFLMVFSVHTVFSQTDSLPPIARDDSKSTFKDVTVTINVIENDSDPDSLGGIDPGTVDLDVGRNGIQDKMDTPQGKFEVNNSGVVTFDPKPDFVGTATNSYTVRDNAGKTSNSALIAITVENPPNAAPVANNDAASTNANTPVTINVTSNDTDSDGTINNASVDLNTAQSGIQNSITTLAGTYSVNTSGVVTYTPTTIFIGVTSTTYTVNDNTGATSNIATITVTVTVIPNVAPVAVNDAATTTQNSPVTINTVANDTDIDGTIDATTVDLNTTLTGIQNSNSTTQGSFAVNTSGVVTYTPATDFSGTATLPYSVNDNDGATSNTATISIIVSVAPNVKPTATNDAASTTENSLVTINVLANDTDSDGTLNAATVDLNTSQGGIQSSNSTAQGSFSANTTGVVTYTPANNFSGTASIKYTVNDDDGATSNEATITVTVTAEPNKSPIAVNDAATTSFNSPATIDVTSNDTDSDGTINKASVDLNTTQSGIQNSNSTTQGVFAVNATGVVTFTPANNFTGTASVKYTVNDNEGATSNEATITVTVNADPNKAPVAVNDAATTSINTAVTIDVTANDTDSDGSINKTTVDLNTTQTGIQNTSATLQGTFSANTAGVVTFTPTAGFTGTASGKYSVNDDDGATSNTATITITVTPAENKAPIAANDAATTNSNTTVTIDVTANDNDSDGTINKATVDLNTSQAGIQTSGSTAQGNFTVNNAGVVTFTPVTNFSGTASITYTVNDNEGLKSNNATINVRVNAPNTAPTAVADNAATESGTNTLIDVLANDTDSDGTLDPTSVDLNPATGGIQKKVEITQGTFEVNASGIVSYTPANNFLGVVSISYVVKDNEGAVSNAASVTVEVTEDPVLGFDIPTGFTPNGDGANETWKIISKKGSMAEMPPADVKVFDKRGALVYDSSGFEKQWDGKHNGQSLPADSYYYIIHLKQGGKTYKGIVTILTNSP